ncbi:hypothetical protein [Kiloniella spongiae]|uniref:hypothetical protein n=1 Tax=Kiloniella spongiae TaxID=1489064 RepID=UPI000699A391|nr:hypothetical protein [Kiloniella spongiae]
MRITGDMALVELDERTQNTNIEADVDKQSGFSEDPFIKHYFCRIDPDIAASFTHDQKHAIKQMFGARGYAKHPVEVRKSIPFGRHRFYLIFLLGRERRAYERLKSEGQASGYVAYALASAFWLAPAIMIAALIHFFG